MDKKIGDVTEKYLFQLCNDLASELIGRVLTITDAAAQDEVQRKAMKDLIQTAVWSTIHEKERAVSYFCDDLRTELGEKMIECPPSDIKRVSEFN